MSSKRNFALSVSLVALFLIRLRRSSSFSWGKDENKSPGSDATHLISSIEDAEGGAAKSIMRLMTSEVSNGGPEGVVMVVLAVVVVDGVVLTVVEGDGEGC